MSSPIDDTYNFDINQFYGNHFNDFLKTAPKFIYHLFGIYNKSSKTWWKLNETVPNKKCQLKIIPNALFTDEKTMTLVLEFLSCEEKLMRLFICLLIEEYDPCYNVNLFPGVIALHQLIIKNPDQSAAFQCLKEIYKRKRKLHHISYQTHIHREMKGQLDEIFQNDSRQRIAELLAYKMVHNEVFQKNYGRYERAAFRLSHCQIEEEIFIWAGLLRVVVSGGGSGDSDTDTGTDSGNTDHIEIVMDSLFDRRSHSFKMSSTNEARATQFVLATQLDLLKEGHCRQMKRFSPRCCMRQHWEIRQIVTGPNAGRNIVFLEQRHLTRDYDIIKYTGNSCEIQFAPLAVANSHRVDNVCIKALKDPGKSEPFWQLWTKCSEWHHPNILQFYGLLKFSCGFFREVATGPLIFSLYNNDDDLRFRDVMNILLGIGSALEYLHECVQMPHEDVTLKSIFKVNHTYKLSEPSISETKADCMTYVRLFHPEMQHDNVNKFSQDLIWLLLSVVFIYYMNEKSCRDQINEATFASTSCHQQLRSVMLQCLRDGHSIHQLLVQIYELLHSFDDVTMDDIVVSSNNKWIPEFLKAYTRDAIMFELNEITFQQISIGKKIGEGHYSEVFEGIYKHAGNSSNVAVKKYRGDVQLSHIKNELKPTIDVHDNVLKFYGYSISGSRFYLISELGTSSLLRYLKQKKSPPREETCHNFCVQICEGMEFLSDEKKFIHRDLAARNVIVFQMGSDDDANVVLKIGDFGLTLALKDHKEYYKGNKEGNYLCLPTQDIKTGKFTQKTDIYSFGLLMWEIFSGGKKVESVKPIVLPKLDICDWAFNIMTNCCQEQEEDRPDNFRTIKELLMSK